MKKYILPSVLALCTFQPQYANADIEKYTFDKTHTQIIFSVDHLGFSHSHGRFMDFDGGFMFDRAEPAKSAVDIAIKTTSLEMLDQKWNEHLKGPDFFNVEKFPAMTFKNTKIEVTGQNTANITGDLTLMGVTKPVTLATTFNKADKHAFSGKYVAGFTADATIKRSDFGLSYGLPMVGDETQIHLEVEGIREDSAADGTANR